MRQKINGVIVIVLYNIINFNSSYSFLFGHEHFISVLIYHKIYIIYRQGLERGWRTHTVFILNLAFTELSYCTFNLPSYASTYLARGWPFGYNLCGISSAFIHMNAYACWISQGLIALSRCLSLTKPSWWNKFCSQRNILIVFVSVWIYAFMLILPTIIVVRSFVRF